MSVLHAYFHRRDQQAFQRAIDASIRALSSSAESKPSSSFGRSLSTSPHIALGSSSLCDVNARDALGRTVLHLACASTHPSAPTYVRLLLSHPQIQPNVYDAESHWTPLHRALYHGNVAQALLLLQRSDVDVYAKDWEGYTAYDVWNSSIEGTKPRQPVLDGEEEEDELAAELYVWGSNRNAGLGVGDADDRTFPDLVQIGRDRDKGNGKCLVERLGAVKVRNVSMARFHTAIVTTEPRTNVLVCGFGSSGRLGPGVHTTTYTPSPLAGLPASTTSTPHLSSHHSSSTSHSLPHPRADRQNSSHRPPNDPHRIVSIAAGQDHTLVLTASGDVWSWGSNRNAVLGYTIDSPDSDPSAQRADSKKQAEKHDTRKAEKDGGAVQTTPRKVQGGLKGKKVRVVAACRTASAAVTEEGEVLTWGVNSGQLGYDRIAHPVQVLPRVVSKVSQPVVDVTITDTATILLLSTSDALCLHANASFRLTFPAHSFPAAIAAYRPPQAARTASIRRVVATELPASASAGGRESAMFVAVSRGGEVFTWVLGATDANENQRERERREVVRPQRVWALRKKFSAVRDVALGADGSILVCTESGHVFLRSRAPIAASATDTPDAAAANNNGPGSTNVGKAFKFQRVPYLQRVVRVYANSAGAYAALRVDAKAEEVPLSGKTVEEDIGTVVPWLANLDLSIDSGSDMGLSEDGDPLARDREDEDLHDPAILSDQRSLLTFLSLLEQHAEAKKAGSPSPLGADAPRIHGADTLVHILGGVDPHIPAHRAVLAARSPILRAVLTGTQTIEARIPGGGTIRLSLAKGTSTKHVAPADGRHPAPWSRPARLTISGAHPLSVLVLLHYLYTDALIAPWDWRVARAPALSWLKARPAAMKAELVALASALALPEMERAMEGAFKRAPEPTLAGHLGRVCEEVCCASAPMGALTDPLCSDVVLLLEDREVQCHSVVLRARSPFFKAFFDEEAWTVNRWTGERTIRVDLKHIQWREGAFVVWYLYGGEGEMFDVLEDVTSVDELLELMFSVMSAANELLLDRLVLLCSRVIQKFITISNACSILSDASYFHAYPLTRSVQGYMARNLETMLESHMLNDLPADLIKQFSTFIREQQTSKSPLSRSGCLVDEAMLKHKTWLETEDFPQPIVRTSAGRPVAIGRKRSVGASPVTGPENGPLSSCKPVAQQSAPAQEVTDGGMFMMDSMDVIPLLNLSQTQTSKGLQEAGTKGAGWRVQSATPRVDMKSIIAEAQTNKATVPRTPVVAPTTPRQPAASDSPNWRTSQRKTAALPTDTPRPTPGSPWKTIPSVPSIANLASSANHSPVQTPPMTPQMRATRPREETPVAGSSKSQAAAPQRPGMGPVFSPAKQSSSKSNTAPGMRRVSSGAAAAWTLPPVQPVVQSSPATSGMSFVAIQELQREQEHITPKKDRRSLKEIQEEEQARQVEADFMRWWAAEEERLRAEQMPPQTAVPAPRSAKGKKDGSREKGPREGARRDGARDGEKAQAARGEGARGDASNAPRRRRRPAPSAAANKDSKVDINGRTHQ